MTKLGSEMQEHNLNTISHVKGILNPLTLSYKANT